MQNTHIKKESKKKPKKPSKKMSSTLIKHDSHTQKPTPPAVDLHWEMIQKIDKLIENHEKSEEHQPKTFHQPQEESCVELRMPLNKHVELVQSPTFHQNHPAPQFQDEIRAENIRSMIRLPEEFALDLPLTRNPEFRFIKTLPEDEQIFSMEDPNDNRVEIINIKSTMKTNETTSSSLSMMTAQASTSQQNTTTHQRNENKNVTQQHQNQHTQTQPATSKEQVDRSGLFYVSTKKNHENNTVKKEQTTTQPQNTSKSTDDETSSETQKTNLKIDKQLQKLEEKKKKLEEKRILEEQRKRILEEKRLLKLELKQKKEEEKKKRKRTELKMKQLNKQAKKEQQPEEELMLDEDLKRLLLITDNLLGKLPENVIEEFAQSKEFALYEKILQKYRIK